MRDAVLQPSFTRISTERGSLIEKQVGRSNAAQTCHPTVRNRLPVELTLRSMAIAAEPVETADKFLYV